MKSGDLYYVPQNVTLVQYDDKFASPKAFYKTDKPLNVVVVDERDDELVEVFCNGQKWCAPKSSLYRLEELCRS